MRGSASRHVTWSRSDSRRRSEVLCPADGRTNGTKSRTFGLWRFLRAPNKGLAYLFAIRPTHKIAASSRRLDEIERGVPGMRPRATPASVRVGSRLSGDRCHVCYQDSAFLAVLADALRWLSFLLLEMWPGRMRMRTLWRERCA